MHALGLAQSRGLVRRGVTACVVAVTLSLSAVASAVTYPIDENTKVVGADTTYLVERGGTTTLEYVAAHFQLGLSNMIEANPGVDPIVPMAGTNLIIPRRLILPDTPRKGIIVNSPEMRLYYYHDNEVDVLPIGIGQLGTDTPLNWVTKVERKRGNYLDQFDGKGLYDANWDVKKFNGDFDYFTGATVTSRAVVLATRDFLEVMMGTDLEQLPNCN